MTKEVKISVCGMQWGDGIEENTIESKTGGEYYYKNGSSYIFYEEFAEEFSKPSKTRIKWKGNGLELIRQGGVDTHMIFEENQTHMTNYVTPYGSLFLGVKTKTVNIEEKEDTISILVEYQLELEEEVLSQHRLIIKVIPIQ